MPEPERVLVARDVDVEPLLRSARAEIAQLSLQIRSANHEADELEAALAEDDTAARDLLRISLDELLETRRHELEEAFERELVAVTSIVASAKRDAARSRLASQLEPTPTTVDPVPQRRLQVVADAEPAHDRVSIDASVAGALLGAAAPVSGDVAPDAVDAEPDAVDAEPDAVDSEPDASDSGPDTPESEPSEADAGPVAPDVVPGEISSDTALLRELVSAAVTAAVAQSAVHLAEARAAAPHTPPGPTMTTAVHAAVPGPGRRPSVGRQLLHVDVLLPLVLVVIVFVVLLAWVG